MFCENEVSSQPEEDLPDMELGILRGQVGKHGGESHSQEEEQQPSGS